MDRAGSFGIIEQPSTPPMTGKTQLTLLLPPTPAQGDLQRLWHQARRQWRQRALHLGWTVIDCDQLVDGDPYALPGGGRALMPQGAARQALADFLAQWAAGTTIAPTIAVQQGPRFIYAGEQRSVALIASGPVLEGDWRDEEDNVAFVDGENNFLLWQKIIGPEQQAAEDVFVTQWAGEGCLLVGDNR